MPSTPSVGAPGTATAVPRRRIAAALAAVALTAGVASASVASPPDTALVASLGTATLTGAGGDALFSEADLAPGRVVRRCVVIGSGEGRAGTVRLVAADVSGALAPYLRLTIGVGDGGGRDTCAGFAGAVAYQGSLAELGAAGPDGVDTGWQTGSTGASRTFEISAEVADSDAAQNKSAKADFRWVLVPSESPAMPSPAASSPEAPTPEASTPEASSPAAPVAPRPGSARTLAPPPGGTASGAPAPASSTPRLPAGGVTNEAGKGGRDFAERLRHIVGAALRFALQAGKHAAVPVLAIVLAVLFLAVQNHIDGRDPKLRLAPLKRDRYLSFDEPEGSEPAPAARHRHRATG